MELQVVPPRINGGSLRESCSPPRPPPSRGAEAIIGGVKVQAIHDPPATRRALRGSHGGGPRQSARHARSRPQLLRVLPPHRQGNQHRGGCRGPWHRYARHRRLVWARRQRQERPILPRRRGVGTGRTMARATALGTSPADKGEFLHDERPSSSATRAVFCSIQQVAFA